MEAFKKQNGSLYNDSLIKEVEGLELLRENLEDNPYLNIPKVLKKSSNTILLQKIDQKYPLQKHMFDLGKGLGLMHTKVFENYGLDSDNYIGLNPQKNTLSKNWGEFFIEYRLLYQINLIKNNDIKKEFENIIDQNRIKLELFLNANSTHPSLLHGDLWSGNVLFDDEKVWLIDPAVYYGDREVDIAMSEMFGGFGEEFYNSYNQTYPLSKEYKTKKIIYNLYHYLNHYNLFGLGYLGGCESGFEVIGGL